MTLSTQGRRLIIKFDTIEEKDAFYAVFNTIRIIDVVCALPAERIRSVMWTIPGMRDAGFRGTNLI
jgi:hypothetical protein